MEKSRIKLTLKEVLKLLLLGLCVYAAMDCSHTSAVLGAASAFTAGKFIYFTFISLYLTIISTVLGYIVKTKAGKKLEAVYKDMLAVAFSLEGIVTVLFWSLYVTDRKLLLGKSVMNDSDSLFIEMSSHLFPIVLLLISQAEVRLRKERRCIYFIFGSGILYLLEITYFHKKDNKWPYPIFKDPQGSAFNYGPLKRILFIAASCLIGVAFYRSLISINDTIHQGYEESESNQI
ncbi:hypothetical protein EHEL_030960 [Encephalitozoon hellem ATCC 50504]|uniref:FAR-17a/AIG1-like protein n=1 Tax=Encephalitozoon hellem TaxID=27973 RepID=A0A9Q9C996_ENCHE|nr:uncharacterized protein EHEL_030960 [Encephalitozoon hellem ATCC 50504]AFM97993.1 hypothetical protein EHEL_030960 [Encephalitozoon hellem ATCC 50504]UTX42797.1 FAR-17a/AIG1-like protein [Encephalitozoon hellem]WEL38256.1 FAR-17a/AIG1-like protein [Encephalitozoon hellem]|eukprot:XP_003886974.1 hypothetical protein EHEL_030960 [Encephalitozoon hellem ATCC 50504]